MTSGSRLLALLGLTAATIWALAQESEPEPAEPPPSGEESEGGSPPPSMDIFIPSEEIAADEEVTFPVDI